MAASDGMSEEALRRALELCLATLTDEQLSKWTYVESGDMYADFHKAAEAARAALSEGQAPALERGSIRDRVADYELSNAAPQQALEPETDEDRKALARGEIPAHIAAPAEQALEPVAQEPEQVANALPNLHAWLTMMLAEADGALRTNSRDVADWRDDVEFFAIKFQSALDELRNAAGMEAARAKAIEAAAQVYEPSAEAVRLMVGEVTTGEMRLILAVLRGYAAKVRALAKGAGS